MADPHPTSRKTIDAAAQARNLLAEAAERSADLSGLTARELVEDGHSLRDDAATVLGLHHTRVRQLLHTDPSDRKPVVAPITNIRSGRND